ncbi:hypothetical protein ACSEPQ_07120 [Pseudomonas aeruginosa]
MAVVKKSQQYSYKCLLESCAKTFLRSRHVKPDNRYCTRDCRRLDKSNKTQEKKVKLKLSKLTVNEFWDWVFQECRRAGTVQVLSDHTPETLHQLATLHSDRVRKGPKWHICHIQPVKGRNSIGLLHPSNLFIGESWLNHSESNTGVDQTRGLSIPKPSILGKFKVAANATVDQVKKLVETFLGDTLTEYLRQYPVRTDERFKLIAKVAEAVESNPDLVEAFAEQFPIIQEDALREVLRSSRISDLRKLKATLYDEAPKHGFRSTSASPSSLVTYSAETQRLASSATSSRQRLDCSVSSSAIGVIGVHRAAGNGYGQGVDLSAFFDQSPWVSWSPLQLEQDADLSKLADYSKLSAYDAMQGKGIDQQGLRERVARSFSVSSTSVNLEPLRRYVSWHWLWETNIPQLEQQVERAYTAMVDVGLMSIFEAEYYLHSFKVELAKYLWQARLIYSDDYPRSDLPEYMVRNDLMTELEKDFEFSHHADDLSAI